MKLMIGKDAEREELERLNRRAERNRGIAYETQRGSMAEGMRRLQRIRLTTALRTMVAVLCCMVAVACWTAAPWWTAVVPMINALHCLRKVLR